MLNIRNTLAVAAFAGLGLTANAAVVLVTTDVAANTTWTSDNTYVLQGDSETKQGVIRVLPGVTLTIQSGTVVRGQPRTNAGAYDAGSLAVLRGGKIIANGTPGDPIVFTTAAIDLDDDGVPDNYTRNGLPGSGPAAAVFAQRYVDGVHVEADFWDNDPKGAPKSNTVTGLWGGVIVLGKAPVNYAALADAPVVGSGNPSPNPYTDDYTKPVIEGLVSPDFQFGSDWAAADVLPAGTPGTYVKTGAIDAEDDSGSLTYISIRHGGIQIEANDEINGLTLGGVGRGTRVSYIEVWGNEDDGVEVFGGTVDMDHVAITGTKDDGLDLDHGYTGRVQFVLVIGGSYAERLGEWDGDDGDESGDGKAVKANFEPRASAQIRNATFIQSPTDRGEIVRARNNASYALYNAIAYRSVGGIRGFRFDSTFKTELRQYMINGVTTGTLVDLNAACLTSNTGSNTAAAGISAPVFVADSIAADDAVHGTSLTRPSAIDVRPSGAFFLANQPLPNNSSGFVPASYRGAFPSSGALWTSGGWAAVANYLAP